MTPSNKAGLRLIKEFGDGTQLFYGDGAFDEWCVYLSGTNATLKPPKDIDYFHELLELGKLHGAERTYAAFVMVYDLVRSEKRLSKTGNAAICDIAATFGAAAVQVERLLFVLYATMVAEERKAGTRLGARVKRLGVHQLLKDSPPLSPVEAANFTRGMKAADIDQLCMQRGF